jgi:hypothetical protein
VFAEGFEAEQQNSAFDKAVVELRIPYSMHVDDAWL